MNKQLTTSLYLFKRTNSSWQVLLIFHKKLNCWLAPGGHVEVYENTEEGALRELFEETGLIGELITFRDLPIVYSDSTWVCPAEFIYDQIIPATPREPEHIHSDSTYFAVCNNEKEVVVQEQEVSRFHWYVQDDIETLNTFVGVKNIILYCFQKLNEDTVYYVKDYRKNGVQYA